MARNYLAQLLSSAAAGTTEPLQQMAAPAPAQASNPILDMVNGYGLYQQAHGGHTDPLIDSAMSGMDQGTPSAPSGISVVGDAPQVSTHGKHAGQARTTIDLGGGMRANVYYDKSGKRSVEKYRA